MSYIDYSQVRVRQAAREKELVKAYENDQFLRQAGKSSFSAAGPVFERLGNSLIRVGERLKDTGNGHSKIKVATCDCN